MNHITTGTTAYIPAAFPAPVNGEQPILGIGVPAISGNEQDFPHVHNSCNESSFPAPLDADRRHDKDGIGDEAPLSDSAQISPQGATRQSVLLEAQGLVHGARNLTYGAPIEDYTRTAAMVSAMLAHKLKEPLSAEDMICAMICVKLSRQQNSQKRDNAVDGAGYFECLQWVIDERAARG